MKRVVIWAATLLVLVLGSLGAFAWYMYYSGGSEIPPDLLVEVAEEPLSEQELEAVLDRWLPDRRARGDALVPDGTGPGGSSPPVETESESEAGSGGEPVSEPEPELVTEESIVREYLPQFLHLERRVNASLERLLQSGLEDYRLLDETGSGGTGELASKYLKSVRLLEEASDQEFDTLVEQMRGALRAADLPTGVVKHAQQEYKDRKKERREALAEKARAML